MKNDWENGPTDPLHISCICSIWKILHFYSSFSLNQSKSAFFHALTLSLLPKHHMLFIVSKQCACSRRVHIEGHMNRFEFLSSRTKILITIVLGIFVKKSYLLQHNSVLIFILWRSVRKNFGYEKITILVDNIPLKNSWRNILVNIISVKYCDEGLTYHRDTRWTS
jgi:hypothetical protein